MQGTSIIDNPLRTPSADLTGIFGLGFGQKKHPHPTLDVGVLRNNRLDAECRYVPRGLFVPDSISAVSDKLHASYGTHLRDRLLSEDTELGDLGIWIQFCFLGTKIPSEESIFCSGRLFDQRRNLYE